MKILLAAAFYVWYSADGMKHISNVPPECIKDGKLVIATQCQGEYGGVEMRAPTHRPRHRELVQSEEDFDAQLAREMARKRKRALAEQELEHELAQQRMRNAHERIQESHRLNREARERNE